MEIKIRAKVVKRAALEHRYGAGFEVYLLVLKFGRNKVLEYLVIRLELLRNRSVYTCKNAYLASTVAHIFLLHYQRTYLLFLVSQVSFL